MNAEYGDITRTSPDARLVNTCGVTACASAIAPSLPLGASGAGLPGGELVTDDLATPDPHDQSSQHPLPVLAPRVVRGGATEPDRSAGLVDVPMQPHGRLVLLERVRDGLTPGAVVDRLSVLDQRRRRPHRGVELQACIEARVERRAVEVEDAPRG